MTILLGFLPFLGTFGAFLHQKGVYNTPDNFENVEKSQLKTKKRELFHRKSSRGSRLVAIQDLEVSRGLIYHDFRTFFGSHLVAQNGYQGKISLFSRRIVLSSTSDRASGWKRVWRKRHFGRGSTKNGTFWSRFLCFFAVSVELYTPFWPKNAPKGPKKGKKPNKMVKVRFP